MSSTTTLIVCRHVESVAAAKGRCEGSFDTEVSEAGKAQLRDLFVPHSEFRPLAAVYTSPLQRARSVAVRLNAALDVPVLSVSQLRARNLGELQGRSWNDLTERESLLMERCFAEDDVAPLGGETSRQVRTRVLTAIERIAVAHAGDRVAIVTHSEPIGVICDYFGVRRGGANIGLGGFVIAHVELPNSVRAAC